MITASAPGMIVLFGEHAVVYGEMAIATAINKRVNVTATELDTRNIVVESKNMGRTFEGPLYGETTEPVIRAVQAALEKTGKRRGIGISIDSNIPVGVGMGSSASVSVATAAAVLKLLQDDFDPIDVCTIAYEAEKVVHGNPSGVVNTIATFGGTITFKQGTLEGIDSKVLSLVVGNTGIPRNTTAMVEKVKEHIEDPRMAHSLFNIGAISWKAKEALANKNIEEIGQLMDKNHAFLRDLGVSSPELETLVKAAKKTGAYGAKLTGAGGGGIMIALTDTAQEVITALKEKGATAFKIKTNQPGVKIEG